MAKPNADALTREGAGNWRTKDGRFLIRGESGAHWYVVDAMRHDAFGLELVTGPYSTINAAKAAIAGARDEMTEADAAAAGAGKGPPEVEGSAPGAADAGAAPGAADAGAAPGADAGAAESRTARARTSQASKRRPGDPKGPAAPAPEAAEPRTSEATKARSGEPRGPEASAAGASTADDAPRPGRAPEAAASPPVASKDAATALEEGASSRAAGAAPVPTPPAAPPPEPEWLIRLPEAERRRARRTMAELERIDIADAAGVVRRDVSAGTPEVARALLRRRLAAIADRSADPDLARAVLGEAIRLVAIAGHDPDAPELAGWALVETGRSTAPRRILLDRDDLEPVPGESAPLPDRRRRRTAR